MAPRDVEMKAGTVRATRSAGEVRRALERAAAAGDPVSILVTFDTPEGPRSRYIDRDRSGVLESVPAGAKRGAGTPTADREGQKPAGQVQVIAGKGGVGKIDAQKLLDLADYYDSLWDALYDLWEEDY